MPVLSSKSFITLAFFLFLAWIYRTIYFGRQAMHVSCLRWFCVYVFANLRIFFRYMLGRNFIFAV
jgi:hypothetical protein